jgi:hypothetical protein
MTLTPFADEATSLRIGALTIENRLDRVSFYGSLDLTRDLVGLRRARDLRAVLDRVVAMLERDEKTLPATAEDPGNADRVRNPFG